MHALALKPRPGRQSPAAPDRPSRASSSAGGRGSARLIQCYLGSRASHSEPHEQEAERIARQVSQDPPAPSRRPQATPSSGGSGEPLDPATREDMESRLGHDFGHVRIHRDATAAAGARALGAHAFTVGQDVAFAAGRYDPASPGGRRLLAHELVHTLQQGNAPGVTGAAPAVQRDPAPGAPAVAPEPTVLERLDAMIKAVTPPSGTRQLTPPELAVVMQAEADRQTVLSAAIERLDRLTRLLAGNAAELRPMAPEIRQAIVLVRRYLRVYESGWIDNERLEFDWVNDTGNRRYLQTAIRAMELMTANRALQLPKVHLVSPSRCDQQRGLYAETTGGFVRLCPNFFGTGPDQPPTCTVWTLVHEYFHPLGVKHGETAGGRNDPLPAGPEQALQNANALASLALELAGRDLKACNAYDWVAVAQIADTAYLRYKYR